MKVLVVEGDKLGRQAIVEALLRVERVAVQAAVPDLASAIRALVDHPPDVVVTGVELADGSGLQVIAAARDRERAPSIVVVGRDASREEWRRHLEAGADRFVELDREHHELREVIGALAHREELDPLRLLGRLAAGTTHDFNNYLTVIGATLALHERTADARLLAEARLAVDSATRLTATLMAYAQGRSPEPELVSLAAVVRTALAVARSSLPPHLEIELALGDQLVRGVASELEQLVLNLVLDAADAMPAGGHLLVRVAGAVTLEVSHDGAPGRRTLGLAIVRAVAARHRAILRSAGAAIQIAFPPPG